MYTDENQQLHSLLTPNNNYDTFHCRMFLPLILITILALLSLYSGSRKPKGFPPGPKWWPIVGSAIEVSRIRKRTGFLYKTFAVLCEQYGPVFGIKIGKDNIVVLNNYETIQSMLTNEDCDGRPTGLFYQTRTWGERRGIVINDGPNWVEQRRLTVRHLKELGFGKTTMASLIEREAVQFVDYFASLFEANNNGRGANLKSVITDDIRNTNNNNGRIYQLTSELDSVEKEKQNNLNQDCDKKTRRVIHSNGSLKIEDMYVKPEEYDDVRKLAQSSGIIVSVTDIFGVPVINSLWSMIAGKRYNNDDKELLYLLKLLTKLLKEIDIVGCLFSHFPILRYIAPEMSGYNQFLDVHKQLWTFLNKELDHHKSTFNPAKLRDFMDAYIKTSQADVNENYSEPELIATCMDLFMAGSETSSKTMDICLLYLMVYPDVQIKAQKEIDTITGNDRLPSIADKPRMPYVNAIVLESLRIFMGRTMNIPHRALKDTVIGGYRIPKDTMIVANFNRILMDEFWVDPHVFRPERFLNEAGTVTIPNQYIPFSFGKRRCMGEALAKNNLFLLTATLLQKFNFSAAPGDNKPLLDFEDGVTVSPKPYRSLVTLRFKDKNLH